MTDPDDDLLRRLRTGGDDAHQALHALLMAMDKDLIRFLRGKGATLEEAADLVGEVFGDKIPKALPGFRGEGSFRGWIQRLAHTALLDHWRRQQRLVQLDHLARPDGADLDIQLRARGDGRSGPTLPPDALAARQLLDCVRPRFQQFARAHPEEAEDLLLSIDEGLRSKQLAERRGISDDAMRARLSRARAALRLLLKECEVHVREPAP